MTFSLEQTAGSAAAGSDTSTPRLHLACCGSEKLTSVTAVEEVLAAATGRQAMGGSDGSGSSRLVVGFHASDFVVFSSEDEAEVSPV